MPARRYNCGCGKKRYRDERSALEAASTDQQRYGDAVTAYRCPGGLAWHLTAHGFTPGALRSVGRRLAFELLDHGALDLDDFLERALGGRTADDRRRQRAERCAAQMAALGLVRPAATGAGRRLVAVDEPGLARVVQIGLDAYTASPDRRRPAGPEPFEPQ